ncbi:hypothetical protein M9H77_17678 [Catharanthus roseus]|uniref:Uncharacterized protein n=1 Tax=Catharanthus roseus TaxID=4058 RepID=A0ACC0B596_CATRO|nr:hypothetical protein M9H77_17678 [Catharanthus roseus]
MQIEIAKGTSLEDLEDSTSNGEEGKNPTVGGRVHLLSKVRSWEGKRKCYLPSTVGSPYHRQFNKPLNGMAYSKLGRASSNCYKDGGYDRNAYGGSHHRDGNLTHRSQMGIGNFFSRAKTFDHIPYDDYGVYEGINDAYDYC